MIRRRLSLGFSLLWRTYVVYFIYSGGLGTGVRPAGAHQQRLLAVRAVNRPGFVRAPARNPGGRMPYQCAAGSVRRTVEALSGAMANLRSSTLTGVGRAGHLERPAGVFCAG